MFQRRFLYENDQLLFVPFETKRLGFLTLFLPVGVVDISTGSEIWGASESRVLTFLCTIKKGLCILEPPFEPI